MSDEALERLRALCLALPEATEDEGGVGSPSFKVRDKIFAMRHPAKDGRPSLWFKAPQGFQEMIVNAEPERFLCRLTWGSMAGSAFGLMSRSTGISLAIWCWTATG